MKVRREFPRDLYGCAFRIVNHGYSSLIGGPTAACVRVGRSYEHVPITRCNVDYGIDPHVEGYCVLLKDGRLATNHEDPAIPCKHDDAGWDRTTVTS